VNAHMPELPAEEPARPAVAPARRGRKLGPIRPDTRASHRAWLEPVRSRWEDSGLTQAELAELAGFGTGRISEFLAGAQYPTWPMTYAIAQVLGLPGGPILRLWKAGARDAEKPERWIAKSAVMETELDLGRAPVDYEVFTADKRGLYTDFAEVILTTHQRARWVVSQALDMLWLRWDEALASPGATRYAWDLVRRCVMARAHLVRGRYPDLRTSAFSLPDAPAPVPGAVPLVTELAPDGDLDGQTQRIVRRMALYSVVGRLPHNQFDITVLVILRGIDIATAASVLGVTPAVARTFLVHAKASLETALSTALPALGE